MYLKRKIDDYLQTWKEDKNHNPLIIKGARQVGKTASIKQFSKNYDYFININSVQDPHYSDITYSIKLGKANIGYHNNIYTFPYFTAFLLKRYLLKKYNK